MKMYTINCFILLIKNLELIAISRYGRIAIRGPNISMALFTGQPLGVVEI